MRAIMSARCWTGRYGSVLDCRNRELPVRSSQTCLLSTRGQEEVCIKWPNQNAKVPDVCAVGPADSEEDFGRAEFVGLYGVSEPSSFIAALGKAEVGYLWYNITETAQNRAEIVVTTVYCTIAAVFASHWMGSLRLNEILDD